MVKDMMVDIDKERIKIQKRKKTNAYKKKRLIVNTRRKLFFICKILSLTFRSFIDQYMESDKDRLHLLQ